MPFIFEPKQYVKELLYSNGIKISKLYATSTEDLNQNEAKKLEALNPALLTNAKKTLDRLDRSDNKKGIKFNRNIRNTVIGTTQSYIMEQLRAGEDRNNPTLVRIIPSTAKEQDAYHARFYGKVMSLEAALEIGITLRYGCKCGLQFLNHEQEIKERLKQ